MLSFMENKLRKLFLIFESPNIVLFLKTIKNYFRKHWQIGPKFIVLQSDSSYQNVM